MTRASVVVMGTNFAHDLANEEFGLSLAQAISIHLSANHYPPVPSVMVPVCIEAITLANEGEWDARVELPDGVSWRGQNTAPVSAIVEQHHLHEWLADDEWYEENDE